MDNENGVYTPIFGSDVLSHYCVVESSLISYPKVEYWINYGNNGWNLMKGSSVDDAEGYNHINGLNLSQAGTGWVIRNNNFINLFNGFFISQFIPSQQKYFSPEYYRNMDFYNNSLTYLADDAIEPEGACVNLRIYNNTCSKMHVGWSDSPGTVGPIYFIRNFITQWSHYMGGGTAIKANPLWNTLHDFGTAFIYHNTFYQNNNKTFWMISTFNDFFDTYKNNIFSAGPGVYRASKANGEFINLTFDYNSYYTTGSDNLYFYLIKSPVINCYTKQCVNDFGSYNWEINGLFNSETRADFVDPNGSKPDLLASAVEIDKGEIIPGINDGYVGLAPDIGAFEFPDVISLLNQSVELQSFGITATPNPFKSVARIKVMNPGNANSMDVFIYDIAGRKVAEFTNVKNNNVRWNAKAYGSGVYLVKAVLGNRVFQTKLVLR